MEHLDLAALRDKIVEALGGLYYYILKFLGLKIEEHTTDDGQFGEGVLNIPELKD